MKIKTIETIKTKTKIMKTTTLKKIAFAALFAVTSISFAQVGVGTSTPDASAALDVSSTTKGLLPPRMNTAALKAISSPAEGLIVYDTELKSLFVFDGTSWINTKTNQPLVDCDNDISQGTGAVVSMKYNYDGVYNTANYDWCAREITQITENINRPTDPAPLSGKTWLDRNLGAYQVATSSTDAASYGDLYQWGRRMDGHAKRFQRTNDPLENNGTQGAMANGTTEVKANVPTNALFINTNSSNQDDEPFDWRVNLDRDLWDSAGATNNPCPSGYRLPTRSEVGALLGWLSVKTNPLASAIDDSQLNLPSAGFREYRTGDLSNATIGLYWTNNTGSEEADGWSFSSTNASVSNDWRSEGRAVRCVRD